MSGAAFTKGPWKVFLDGGQVGDAQAGGICALWRFNPSASSEENAEARANAKLIAAAPTMFEALERIAWVRDDFSDNGHGSAELLMRKIAEETLAKVQS